MRPSAKGRGVGAALLSWVERRAAQIANEVSLDPEAPLTVTNWAQDCDAPPLLAGAGFEPVRHFLQMRIDLAGVYLAEPVWPEGLQTRCFIPGPDDAALFASFREAFADHWGDAQVNPDEWWRENRTAPNAGFDPTLWFVAVDSGALAGFSICREREADGQAIGWISLLGVRPRWRGRGLGEALLLHSFNVFRERGYRRNALNVDVANTTGALRLYEKVGMEPVPAFTVWSKPIG